MEIASNTTGMNAAFTFWTDPEAVDHCIVVVKGTFDTDVHGVMRLSEQQRPLVYTDEHYGAPETTSIRYENDFAPAKPQGEIIVVGKAVAPDNKPTARVHVRLEIEGRAKEIVVVGDRTWIKGLSGLHPSAPVPFTEMPLTFERAFGGQDDTKGTGAIAVEHRNLVGLGFHPYRRPADVEGQPLPNLERPDEPIRGFRDQPVPIGIGVLGRAWKQRAAYAGTYDQHWFDEVCPFLPRNFDLRHFMSAPDDQWIPKLKEGVVIRCVHMAERPIVRYNLPAMSIPVQFRFVDRTLHRKAELDTMILEPHRGQAMLISRTQVPLGKKLTELRAILVGEQQRGDWSAIMGYRGGKPHFRDLSSATRFLQRTRGR